MAFLIGGLGINFLIDYGIWFHIGVREISLPIHFFGGTFLFFFWFSLSYGVEYAYTFLMFEERNKIKWTLFILMGWLVVALLSQLIPLNNSHIVTIRHMSDLRFIRIGIVIIGYVLLIFLKYDWRKILFLFFIGFLIHFMMEFSLLINGIRPGSLLILLENSLIEFNMGMPFFYLIWDRILKNNKIIKNES